GGGAGEALRNVGQAARDDRRFALCGRVLCPWVEAAALEGVRDFASTVRCDHDGRGRGSAEGTELGDRDLEIGEELEQVRLELLIRSVDLVDEQDGAACVGDG